jgi:GIY-YIG catalytic domain-containing protein
MKDANAVVQELQAPVVVSLVLERPEALPAAPGFYGWWSPRGAIRGLPQIPHPADDDLSLLYVGISPVRESSRQTVRSRVIGNHLNGNVGSSTFRFALAALLVDTLKLRPFLRGSKVALGASENARLSAWQREHLLLTWSTRQRPWEIEGEVIAHLGPPLNSAGNAAHDFYERVREARAELRLRAAERSELG